jgi:hypothetical protein
MSLEGSIKDVAAERAVVKESLEQMRDDAYGSDANRVFKGYIASVNLTNKFAVYTTIFGLGAAFIDRDFLYLALPCALAALYSKKTADETVEGAVKVAKCREIYNTKSLYDSALTETERWLEANRA